MRSNRMASKKASQLCRWFAPFAMATIAACTAAGNDESSKSSERAAGQCLTDPGSQFCQSCKNDPKCMKNHCSVHPMDVGCPDSKWAWCGNKVCPKPPPKSSSTGSGSGSTGSGKGSSGSRAFAAGEIFSDESPAMTKRPPGTEGSMDAI